MGLRGAAAEPMTRATCPLLTACRLMLATCRQCRQLRASTDGRRIRWHIYQRTRQSTANASRTLAAQAAIFSQYAVAAPRWLCCTADVSDELQRHLQPSALPSCRRPPGRQPRSCGAQPQQVRRGAHAPCRGGLLQRMRSLAGLPRLPAYATATLLSSAVELGRCPGATAEPGQRPSFEAKFEQPRADGMQCQSHRQGCGACRGLTW